ncbi:uncharacterized protein ARMOST_17392 [Armillaria ostoyae]|uniref:Uncharacterized protein n=1 Tax=Armillaria ostoyae TaxID=47428 RepID=A0A284RYV5_ARMOS|nr:uncharacterized protein ARMOST_17392 [Armillaria ostoyae]
MTKVQKRRVDNIGKVPPLRKMLRDVQCSLVCPCALSIDISAMVQQRSHRLNSRLKSQHELRLMGRLHKSRE